MLNDEGVSDQDVDLVEVGSQSPFEVNSLKYVLGLGDGLNNFQTNSRGMGCDFEMEMGDTNSSECSTVELSKEVHKELLVFLWSASVLGLVCCFVPFFLFVGCFWCFYGS